jgi:hypothetical protein
MSRPRPTWNWPSDGFTPSGSREAARGLVGSEVFVGSLLWPRKVGKRATGAREDKKRPVGDSALEGGLICDWGFDAEGNRESGVGSEAEAESAEAEANKGAAGGEQGRETGGLEV